MSPRRALTVVAGGCAAGALLLLLAAGRTWATTTLVEPSSGGRLRLSVTGHDVAPSLPALGLALLALAAGIVAARGRLRQVVGGAVAVLAAVAVVVAVTAPRHVSRALEDRELGAQGLPVHAGANGWWVIAAAGALLSLGAGVATLARGRRWTSMGARYDAPTTPSATGAPAEDPWGALDRGEDPTD